MCELRAERPYDLLGADQRNALPCKVRKIAVCVRARPPVFACVYSYKRVYVSICIYPYIFMHTHIYISTRARSAQIAATTAHAPSAAVWMDGWMDGWADGYVYMHACMYTYTYPSMHACIKT